MKHLTKALKEITAADMSKEYDGFFIQNRKTKELTKYRYGKGSNKIYEDKAIQEQMDLTKQPRADFWVHGLIKKGEWDKAHASCALKEIKAAHFSDSLLGTDKVEYNEAENAVMTSLTKLRKVLKKYPSNEAGKLLKVVDNAYRSLMEYL